MFSWATSQFEKLSQTVAPPPDDPASKFVYCCQRQDEVGALEAVHSIHGFGTIVQQNKGRAPIHLACLHGLSQVMQHLLQLPGATLDLADGSGNTPLHCACMSQDMTSTLDMVKMLVSHYQASVVAQNGMGQTPYDVAVLNSVRQYLLPLQLQQETQAALDNGGQGLPPGIDLGGLRISNSHLPPPPIVGERAPPPPPPPMGGSGLAGGATPTSKYVPVPGLAPFMSPPPVPPSPYAITVPVVSSDSHGSGGGGAAPPPTAATTMPSNQVPPLVVDGGSASLSSTDPPTAETAFPATNASALYDQAVANSTIPPPVGSAAQTANNIPSAPSSSGSATNGAAREYARRGYSSAATYKKSKYQADGFHSSSSDKELQKKYGHQAHTYGSVVPPPPSSGNSSGYNFGATAAAAATPAALSLSAPPSMSANPYAGGGAVAASRRYVTYDPISGQRTYGAGGPPAPPPAAPRSGGGGYYGAGNITAAPPVPNYAIFNPAGGPTPAPVAPGPALYPSVPAPQPMANVSPYSSGDGYQQPSLALPPHQQASLPSPPFQRFPPAAPSSGNAADVFARRPEATGAPLPGGEATSQASSGLTSSLGNLMGYATASTDAGQYASERPPPPPAIEVHQPPQPAQSAFYPNASPARVPMTASSRQGSNASSQASDLFSRPAPTALVAAGESTRGELQGSPLSQPHVHYTPALSTTDLDAPVPTAAAPLSENGLQEAFERRAATAADDGDEDEMLDIPLSPDGKTGPRPSSATLPPQQGTQNSLYAAIGMPPPPFSKK